MDETKLVHFLLQLVILVFSLSLHEFGHAYAAYRLGDPTAKMLGRMTLDPRAHIDPIGTLLFPILRFFVPGLLLIGWAKPVPVTPENFKNPRRDDIIVSLAGPAANVLLAFVSVGFLWFLDFSKFFNVGNPSGTAWLGFFSSFFWTNFALAVFNLIPISPLDGSWVLKALLPGKWSYSYSRLDRYGFVLLYAAMYLGILDMLFRPAESSFMSLLYTSGLGRVADMLLG
jgi:Zn-dependent protease